MGFDADIAGVLLRDRPLLVCDLDEVVLEFIGPFTDFLRFHEHDLLPRSFRLHGNIIARSTGLEADKTVVDAFLDDFFAAQDKWQHPAEKAVESLEYLSTFADIVFLTAMPPRHQTIRRALLDHFELAYAMVATEEPKGPVVAALHGNRNLPVAFVDDLQSNLLSVARHVPDCLLVNMMANKQFKAFAPVATGNIVSADDWLQARDLVLGHFGVTPSPGA